MWVRLSLKNSIIVCKVFKDKEKKLMASIYAADGSLGLEKIVCSIKQWPFLGEYLYAH
jgi:hypothetical protein